MGTIKRNNRKWRKKSAPSNGKVTISQPNAQVTQEQGFPMTQEEVDNTKVVEPHSYVMEKYPSLNDSEAMLVHNANTQYKDAQNKYNALLQKDFRNYLSQYTKDESDEEKASREAREAKAQRWAAIADGISALANIGGAMGGATPIQPAKTLSKAQAERMEYSRKIRELHKKEKNKQQSDELKRWEKETEAARKEMRDAEKNLDRTTSSALSMANNRKYKEGMLANQGKRTDSYVDLNKTKEETMESRTNNINKNNDAKTANQNKNNDAKTANQNKNRDEATRVAWYRAKNKPSSKPESDAEKKKKVLGGLRA